MELEERDDYQAICAKLSTLGSEPHVPRHEYMQLLRMVIGECRMYIRAAEEDEEQGR